MAFGDRSRCLGTGLGLEGTGLSLQRQNLDLEAERSLGLGDEVGPLEAVLGAWGRVQVRRRCGLGGVMFGGGAGAERPGSLGNGACPVSDAAPPKVLPEGEPAGGATAPGALPRMRELAAAAQRGRHGRSVCHHAPDPQRVRMCNSRSRGVEGGRAWGRGQT